jgi:thioredoxin 1
MASANVLTITEQNFDTEVLGSDVPVLVDFWATWCGPCRAVAPIVEQLGTEYDGKAKVGKVDVDANRALAMKFNISSIPTIMVFKGGKVVEQVMGARPKPVMSAMLDKHV